MRCVLGSSLLLAALVGLLPAQLRAEENRLTDYEQKSGWKLLFDGQSTTGWRNYRKQEVNPGWVVEEGALVRKGKGAGDIVTANQYDSFELSIEYRISQAGNSGIMFHVTEELDRSPDPEFAGLMFQCRQRRAIANHHQTGASPSSLDQRECLQQNR